MAIFNSFLHVYQRVNMVYVGIPILGFTSILGGNSNKKSH